MITENPSTMLLPGFDYVLIHASFVNKLAFFYRKNDLRVAKKFIMELEKFAEKIKGITTLDELKEIIIRESLKTSKAHPKTYYEKGYVNADNLFFWIPVSVEENDFGGICLFFPVLFEENGFSDELNCCSHRKHFANNNDVRRLEAYHATYQPPLRSTI